MIKNGDKNLTNVKGGKEGLRQSCGTDELRAETGDGVRFRWEGTHSVRIRCDAVSAGG